LGSDCNLPGDGQGNHLHASYVSSLDRFSMDSPILKSMGVPSDLMESIEKHAQASTKASQAYADSSNSPMTVEQQDAAKASHSTIVYLSSRIICIENILDYNGPEDILNMGHFNSKKSLERAIEGWREVYLACFTDSNQVINSKNIIDSIEEVLRRSSDSELP